MRTKQQDRTDRLIDNLEIGKERIKKAKEQNTLQADNAELRAEVDRLNEIIRLMDGKFSEEVEIDNSKFGLELAKAEFNEDGTWTVDLQGERGVSTEVAYMFALMSNLLDTKNVKNYIQFDMKPRLGVNPIRVTIQWAKGESPAEQNERLRAEKKQLEMALSYYHAANRQSNKNPSGFPVPEFIPTKIKLLYTVREDLPPRKRERLLAEPGEYNCTTNKFGAVSILDDRLGCYPFEFEVLEWGINPHFTESDK